MHTQKLNERMTQWKKVAEAAYQNVHLKPQKERKKKKKKKRNLNTKIATITDKI